jgi:hypothetical protein
MCVIRAIAGIGAIHKPLRMPQERFASRGVAIRVSPVGDPPVVRSALSRR